jgi:hypothetical protein
MVESGQREETKKKEEKESAKIVAKVIPLDDDTNHSIEVSKEVFQAFVDHPQVNYCRMAFYILYFTLLKGVIEAWYKVFD